MTNSTENTAGKQRTDRVRGRPFPKGTSGNPKGKPKGTIHMSTLLKNGLQKGAGAIIINKIIEKAKSGDIRAIQLIWERLEGRAPQALDVTTNGENIAPTAESIAIANKILNGIINKVYGAKEKVATNAGLE